MVFNKTGIEYLFLVCLATHWTQFYSYLLSDATVATGCNRVLTVGHDVYRLAGGIVVEFKMVCETMNRVVIQKRV